MIDSALKELNHLLSVLKIPENIKENYKKSCEVLFQNTEPETKTFLIDEFKKELINFNSLLQLLKTKNHKNIIVKELGIVFCEDCLFYISSLNEDATKFRVFCEDCLFYISSLSEDATKFRFNVSLNYKPSITNYLIFKQLNPTEILNCDECKIQGIIK